MCRREGIFFGVVLLWLLLLIILIIFMILGSNILNKYGAYLSIIPTAILLIIIIPRIISKKYNNWLESDLIPQKLEPTIKEIRLSKLKRINKKIR